MFRFPVGIERYDLIRTTHKLRRLSTLWQPGSCAQLLDTLTSGRSVAVTIHFSQCLISSTGTSGPEVVGGFLINGYLVPNNQYIVFSDVHETLDPQNARH